MMRKPENERAGGAEAKLVHIKRARERGTSDELTKFSLRRTPTSPYETQDTTSSDQTQLSRTQGMTVETRPAC